MTAPAASTNRSADERGGTAGSERAAPVVVFTGVHKSFGAVRAVRELSLRLYPGETVALLGPNGAGKSTALDLLLGLRNADRGRVEVFGTTPAQAISAGRVGAMLQSGGLMEEVTVRELVTLACDLHPRAYPVDQVLAAADLSAIADRKVDKLSGGQAQRVRFALATAGANDLIVLDEPTTGMDVNARLAFWATMRAQVDQGRTVLFATHYLEEADAIADRVLVMHRGRVIADGTAAEIKARAGARRVVFDLDGPVDEAALKALPNLVGLTVSPHGGAPGTPPDPGTPADAGTSSPAGTRTDTGSGSGSATVRISSDDADATVHAVYALGLYPRNLEVSGLGLEQAFIAITDAAADAEANAEADTPGAGSANAPGAAGSPAADDATAPQEAGTR